MKKKVYIIYTGGTIGMVASDRGYAPQKGYMQKQLESMSELRDGIMPEYTVNEYDPLLDSANVSQTEWIKIARDIGANYDKYDGFVVLHGTDTMAYTASALSFMLEGLSKPVVITGSQIPLHEARNDARENLITALTIAGNYDIPEVCLCFGGKLLRGNRAVKISSDDLEAFDSPNFPPLAEIGVEINLNRKLILAKPYQTLNLHEFGHYQIAFVKIFPGIQAEVFENMMKPPLKGIVIEAFGTGNIPSRDGKIFNVLERASKEGIIIVVCTQCLKGSTYVGAYEAGRVLLDAGAVSGYDMTAEAAVTKLYYLMSKGYEQDKIKQLMQTDIRGEVTIPQVPAYIH